MLNQSLKTEFVHQYTTAERLGYICSKTFENAGKIEEKYGVDLYAMTLDQLREAVVVVSGVRERSQYQKIAIIKEYCRWCRSEGIEGATANAEELTTLASDKIRRQYVSGPVELQKFLDEIFAPVEWDTIDNIYRGYAWLLFSGVWSDDVLGIEKNDIDFSTMTIRYRLMNQELELYRQAIPAIRKCIHLDRIARYPSADPSGRAYTDRLDNQALLTGLYLVQKIESMNQSMWKRTHDRAVEINTGGAAFRYEVTPQKIFLSGMFYRAYEQERAGNGDGMRSLAENKLMYKKLHGGYKKESGDRYSDEMRLTTLTRLYRKDYTNWKAAFNL